MRSTWPGRSSASNAAWQNSSRPSPNARGREQVQVSEEQPGRTPAEYERKLAPVREIQRALDRAIARGAPTKIANCRRELANAQRAAAKAKAKQCKGPEASGKKAKRGAAADTGGVPDAGSGILYAEDPDARTRTVWIFKTGNSFHRRDCHIVESRDGAIQIPVAVAHKRNLIRCMHCVPTAR